MTRRIISITYGSTLFVSQEFNGDRNEAQIFHLAPISPCWEDIVQLFKGVQSVRAFESALEKAEELFKYEHIPLKEQAVLPETEEVWQMTDSELEIYSRYGQRVS